MLETARDLRNQGIVVSHAVVLLNRQQGGAGNLLESGVFFILSCPPLPWSLLLPLSCLATEFILLVVDVERSFQLRLIGIRLHSVFTVGELLDILHKFHKLDTAKLDLILKFLETPIPTVGSPPTTPFEEKGQQHRLRYGERVTHAKSSFAKKLLALMEEKRTNLVVAADLVTHY